MKNLKTFIVALTLVVLNLHIYSDENDISTLIDWKRTAEYSNGKSNVPGYIRSDVINYLKNIFNNKMTPEARNNSDFQSLPGEQRYYFKDENAEETKSDEDYICVSSITGTGDYNFHIYYINGGEMLNGKPYADYEIEIHLHISFDNNTDANQDYTTSQYDRSQIVSGCGGAHYNDTDDWHNRRVDYDNDHQNPIIYSKVFDLQPKDYFNIDYTDHVHAIGNWYEDPKPDWHNKRKTIKYFKALSPIPRINQIIQKQFDATETNAPQNNKIFDNEIDTDYQVKVLYARFYKYNPNTNKYEYDNDNNPDILKCISQYESGIDYLRITSKILGVDLETKKRFSHEGKYMMVLSCIDKFNKIYVFEPMYFIIDTTPPTVTSAVTEKNKYLTNAVNPVIVNLKNATISDNYTKYPDNNLANYIYVLEGNKFNPAKLNDCTDDSYNLIYDRQNKQIKIKYQDKPIYIKELYIQDNAGNKSDLLINDQEYVWDNTAPIVKPKNTSNYINTNDNLYFDVIEPLNVQVNSVNAMLNNIQSTSYYYYPSRDSGNLLVIDLKPFKGMAGILNINMDLQDEAGNDSKTNFNFILDDKKPVLNATLNDIALTNYYVTDLNNKGTLKINVSDDNFSKIELQFTSNSPTRQKDVTINTNTYTYTITKAADVSEEDLTMNIIAYDLAGNTSNISNIKLKIISDNDAPKIIAMQDTDNPWRYYIEVSDNDAFIKKVYYKDITPSDINNVAMPDFGILPPDKTASGWNVIGQNISFFKCNIDILPVHAACIIAEDAWGNITTSTGVILVNNQPLCIVINSQSDLNNYLDKDGKSWNLSGDVLIKTDITVGLGQTLKITTNTLNPTTFRFDNSTGNKYKVINNGGTIIFDSTNNIIIFNSSGDTSKDYNWFGFINQSGDIQFNGGNINWIYFKDAVCPLTFVDPLNDINIQNIEFRDCKMGIHFIDKCSSYHKLFINNINFINMIYGVKFDFDGDENADLYMQGYPHWQDSNILVDNIIRSHIYCPINGLVNFTNFNIAPKLNDLKITGDPKVGNTLSVDYTYVDNDLQDLTGTKYQWYISTNEQGPYRPIAEATNKDWVVRNGDNCSWIRVRVIPKDAKGGSGNAYYSDVLQILNTVPEASNLSITITPPNPDNIANIYDTLSAQFVYSDADRDMQGEPIYSWFVIDNNTIPSDGSGYEIQGKNTKDIIPGDVNFAGKWIYFGVIPVDQHGMQGDIKYSSPVKISEIIVPIVSNVTISGDAQTNGTLTGSFNVNPTNATLDNFIYKWYISSSKDDNYQQINGYLDKTCSVVSSFEEKWICFEVTPVNIKFESGTPVKSDPVYIPYSLPVAKSVSINVSNNIGDNLPRYGNNLIGTFVYYAANNVAEDLDGSLFQWFASDTQDGTYTAITGQIRYDSNGNVLPITQAMNDTGKYIELEVTPKNSDGKFGLPVRSSFIKLCKKVQGSGSIIRAATNNYIFNFSRGDFKINYPGLFNIIATKITLVGGGGGGGSGGWGIDPDKNTYCAGGGGGAGELISKSNISLEDVKDKDIIIVVGSGGKSSGDSKDGDSGDDGHDGGVSRITVSNDDGSTTDLFVARNGLKGHGGWSTLTNSGNDGHGGGGYPSGKQSHNGGGNGGDNGRGHGDGGDSKSGDNDGKHGDSAPNNSGGGGGGGGCAQTSPTKHGRYGGDGGSGYAEIDWTGYYYSTNW